jgi:hypothetical protein
MHFSSHQTKAPDNLKFLKKSLSKVHMQRAISPQTKVKSKEKRGKKYIYFILFLHFDEEEKTLKQLVAATVYTKLA